MRIAMIGHKDFPSRSGGVEVVVYELATRLQRAGHAVTVYNRGLEKGHNRYTVEGVEVRRSWTVKRQGLNAMLYSLTATLGLIGTRYDLVHYHAIGPCAMLPLAKLFGKRTVATIHGLDWKRAKWGRFAASYLMFGERMLARFADAVIVLSENDETYMKTRYGRDCIRIPNAVYPVSKRPAKEIAERFGLSENGYILFLSRIVPEKGLHDLIAAYRRLTTDTKLVIAGEVPDNAYGERIRTLAEGCDNIVFTGFASGEVLQELYANCRLFVQPSEIEGLALTLLEALSAGARCLVSDIPENVCVARDFTRSFHVADVADLARALADCLNEGTDYPDAAAQRDYIQKHYSYETMLASTLAVYQQVVGEAKS